jgi:hypothetical protein
MILSFSPMRHDTPLEIVRHGDVLVLNGSPLDLTDLPEGAERSAAETGCPWAAGPVRREGGRLHLLLILPHGPFAPVQTLFPARLALDGDGPVPLPPGGWDSPVAGDGDGPPVD